MRIATAQNVGLVAATNHPSFGSLARIVEWLQVHLQRQGTPLQHAHVRDHQVHQDMLSYIDFKLAAGQVCSVPGTLPQ